MKGRAVLLIICFYCFLTAAGYGQEFPFAEILTTDSSWCQHGDNMTTAEILITGEVDTSRFDLVMDIKETRDTLFNLPSGMLTFYLNNKLGVNRYIIFKVIEHQNGTTLENEVNDTLIMEVKAMPDMTFNAEYDTQCSPATVLFTAREGYLDYTWDHGDGSPVNTSENQISHIYTSEEDVDEIVYSTSLKIVTPGGCSDSVTDNFTLFPTPTAGFQVDSVTLHYPNSTVQLENTTTPGSWKFIWDFGDNSRNFTRDPGEHIYNNWGVYDIKMEWYTANCRDSVIQQIEILPPKPVARFTPDTSGCPPLQVSFSNSTLYASSYFWDFDDGSTSSNANPTHSFWNSKSHYVKLFAEGPSGTDTAEQVITVLDRPVADFETEINQSTDESYIYTFTNLSTNSYRYQWDFGDGYTTEDESPVHIFSSAGTYTITLYAWSIDECADTLIREDLVIIEEGNNLFPTVFRWNGTGPTGGAWVEGGEDNTVFHPNITNASSLRMVIFTRLGHRVFETNDIHIGWDGYINSSVLAVQGVYVYKAWITYSNGVEEIHSGDVTFIH